MAEVAGAQVPRFVDLAEEDFLGRSVQRPPPLEAALERPHLAVGEAPGVLTLEVVQ